MRFLVSFNEVRWRLGQETSLAPPCSNLRSFGSKGKVSPLAIRILMFVFLVFHQHCTSRSGALQQRSSAVPQKGATHLLSNQVVMNFRSLRDIEAAFFITAWFVVCTTIYNTGSQPGIHGPQGSTEGFLGSMTFICVR